MTRLEDVLGTLITAIVFFGVLYLAAWGLTACEAWGANNSVKCEIGYDPVTSLCVDGHPSPCSGYSPPFFCWSRPRSDIDDRFEREEKEKARRRRDEFDDPSDSSLDRR